MSKYRAVYFPTVEDHDKARIDGLENQITADYARIAALEREIQVLRSAFDDNKNDYAALEARLREAETHREKNRETAVALQLLVSELEAALREIAVGLIKDDNVADYHNRFQMCASRLCKIARDALTASETGDKHD